MTDYWGAQAVWYSSGPDGFGSWYFPPDNGARVKFTAPIAKDKHGNAVDSGSITIDAFKQQLDNSQPAHLSALADQWQTMHDMLVRIHDQLYAESWDLADHKWTGGKARDAFMKIGPGPILANLDVWKESALSNQKALRAVSNIIIEYQGKIKPLWTEYTQAVKDAQNVSAWHTTLGWLKDYNVFGGSDQHDFDANMATDRANATKDVQTKYNIKAQTMAWEMAQALFETYSPFSGGHGPLYYAPDSLVDDPSGFHGGFGGGAPGSPPPPPPPAAVAPPPTTPSTPTAPTAPTVPTAPTAPSGVPTAPTAPTAPGLPTAPVGLPLLPPVGELLPPGLGAGPAEPSLPGGTTNPFAAPKVPGSGGLISRAAGAQADAGLGNIPRGQGVLGKGTGNLARGPGQPAAPGGRRAGRGNTEESGIEREPGQEDLFGGKGAASPPVLGNRRRNRSRTTMPPVAVGDEFSTALPQHGDAVPSVFGRSTLAGSGPAEVDDSAPALRAGTRPTGVGAEEVAPALRAAPARESAQREIHGRSGRAMGTARPVTPSDPSAIPTDEEAFSVATPGGGVLTGHQEERGYSPEPPAQVRAQ